MEIGKCRGNRAKRSISPTLIWSTCGSARSGSCTRLADRATLERRVPCGGEGVDRVLGAGA
jgi:hypothetical protein